MMPIDGIINGTIQAGVLTPSTDANNPAAGRDRLRTVSETAIMQCLGV